jgi:hypothetical protein
VKEKLSMYADIAEVVGAIAIIVSLVFVALETLLTAKMVLT